MKNHGAPILIGALILVISILLRFKRQSPYEFTDTILRVKHVNEKESDRVKLITRHTRDIQAHSGFPSKTQRMGPA